ncbi:MAG: GGDEF domain-containing protein [Betaproteobacteria bacterium]|nr:GGDEF domain-containing protein [Betaproteobacteria bacterium]
MDLVVPVVFFFGAIFVWVTVALSFQTVRDLRIISRLEHETFTDPLTGAYNRRFLDRRLAEEVASARRYHVPLSVLMVDVDHFKRVNDAHGHPVGDQALVALAAAIAREIRDTDYLTRYGGEEFLVMALHTPRAGALELAERLRRRIESREHVLAGHGGGAVTLRLTVSIGVACFGGRVDTLERLVHVADENLYRAKSEGRNRVACCDPPEVPARPEQAIAIAA